MLNVVKSATSPSEFTVHTGQHLGKPGGVPNLSLQIGEEDMSILFLLENLWESSACLNHQWGGAWCELLGATWS